MSYHVLARKWRPQSFKEMVGQEHVLRPLINALDNQRLHHAYLFTGTRGVGKTTIARILAKCLNCEAGISSSPCNKCSSCVEVLEGRSVDVLEIDAASRTKVEDTRELLENVQYRPARSTFKIYLIDEVHMLSGHSFNALLKTLEEPPPHVKFLLATTDIQKLPATVLSRCLQFCLKNMPEDQIISHLKKVLSSENVNYEEPALFDLARAGAGSMRDALSLTDQAISFGSGEVLTEDVQIMLGAVERRKILTLLEAVAEENPRDALNIIAQMAENAPNFELALDELTSLIHAIAVTQAVPDIDNQYLEHIDHINSLGARLTPEDVQLFYQTAINGKRDLIFAPDLRVGFEMIILRMIAFRPQGVIDENHKTVSLQSDFDDEESTVKGADSSVIEGVQSAQHSNKELSQNKSDIPDLDSLDWNKILVNLDLSGISYNIASHCALANLDQSRVSLILDKEHANLFKERHLKKIQDQLSVYFKKEISLLIEVGQPPSETPAQRFARLEATKKIEAQESVDKDTDLKELMDRFDGKLEPGSIMPLK